MAENFSWFPQEQRDVLNEKFRELERVTNLHLSLDAKFLKRGPLSYEQLLTLLDPEKERGSVASLPANMPVHKIKPIWAPPRSIERRAQLERLVEYPLRDAALRLYDLNVQTIWSSANFKDVGGNAYIEISHVDPANEAKLKEEYLSSVRGEEGNLALYLPVGLETTVGEVKERMEGMVDSLTKQPLRWGRWMTFDDTFHGIACILASNRSVIYDASSHWLFPTKELYDKFHDALDDDQREENEERVAGLLKRWGKQWRPEYEALEARSLYRAA